MLVIPHSIGPSTIHGTGVFTDIDIAPGSLVWKFDPCCDLLISVDEFDRLPPDRQQDIMHHAEWRSDKGAFIMGLDGDFFMNHADEPSLIDLGDTMIASRFLPRGTELTCDYRDVQVLGLDMVSNAAPLEQARRISRVA